MKTSRRVLFCALLVLPAAFFPGLAGADSQTSFADLYRLAVTGQAVGFAAGSDADAAGTAVFPEYQLRAVSSGAAGFAAAPAPAAPAYVFSIGKVPEPAERWILVLAGLAAAAWVARRRLGYSVH